uniref:hypothetical protein n=1 Tax=Paractinoplanes polyasparticus TaxID=2856853 RepID=UPI001C84FE8B|nr:hypothetical protein [Actinoplanes polyasparticus]
MTRFAAGDRVLGHALGIERHHNRAAEGAFQHYVVLAEHMSTPIPAHVRFEQAADLPLALSTAASGLFDPSLLGLARPGTPNPHTGTVLVWGGSTSVGSSAIQLAAIAGYDVIATASPHNHEYVRKLGARAAFDYRNRTIVSDIVDELRGKRLRRGSGDRFRLRAAMSANCAPRPWRT